MTTGNTPTCIRIDNEIVVAVVSLLSSPAELESSTTMIDRRLGVSSMRVHHTLVCCLALLVSVCGNFVFAADEANSQPETSFYNQVRPILQANCHGCHQPAKSLGDYVMTDFQKLLDGGESGLAAVVPGKPEESYLIEQITPTDGEALMPKKADPLIGNDIKIITQWIKEGAKDDTPASAKQRYDRDHPPSIHASQSLRLSIFLPMVVCWPLVDSTKYCCSKGTVPNVSEDLLVSLQKFSPSRFLLMAKN
jgi:mono/diheme cytochrome c family protein